MSDDEYDTITQLRAASSTSPVTRHHQSPRAAEQIVAVIGELTLVVKVGVAGDVVTRAREGVID